MAQEQYWQYQRKYQKDMSGIFDQYKILASLSKTSNADTERGMLTTINEGAIIEGCQLKLPPKLSPKLKQEIAKFFSENKLDPTQLLDSDTFNNLRGKLSDLAWQQ